MRDSPETQQQEISAALDALREDVPQEMRELVPLVYDELRRVAHRQLAAERTGHTLSTTALVHEAWLRLAQARSPWLDREHFFAVAARTMRRVLVDYARRHHAQRRGAGQRVAALEELESSDALAATARAEELIALDEALERLTAVDERLSRVVECRFFAGLSEDETAAALGVSPRTVARDWRMARGWLYHELRHDGS